DGAAAAEHERRKPRRVLHARPRAADRGRAPAPRPIDEPGRGHAGVDGDLGADGDARVERHLRERGDPLMPAAHYLPSGLPAPGPEPDGLDAPYWEGTRQSELRIQHCRSCRTWLWGPEWICHHCLSFDIEWQRVDARGLIYSWERAWHPVHPALKGHPPYI